MHLDFPETCMLRKKKSENLEIFANGYKKKLSFTIIPFRLNNNL